MQFSQSSQKNLATCDVRLQVIMKRALEVSKIDFGISCGYRSVEDQKKAFEAGKSRIDGVTQKSKHNYSPALAVDIFGSLNGKSVYTVPVMSYLAGVIEAVANDIGTPVRWGGNWDQDGEIITDQDFDDLPHFELV